MNFFVTVKPGTEKMVAAGILANVKLEVKNGADGPVAVEVSDICIRSGDKGPWVSYPSRKSNTKDAVTGKDKYFSTVRFFPGDQDKFNAISATILKKYQDEMGGSKAAAPVASKPKTAAPATTAKSDVPKDDPLDGFVF